ncbi:MAG: DNA (cytosine-5-)-methyltransferase, partial [Planctomycetes bacterium]|nr:DNA (cytosine-5-)-methyltransferase [Planctomycetota bacterium]
MPQKVETVASLFSGIGGIELGLEKAGLGTVFQCEICDIASRVLKQHFPTTKFQSDVKLVKSLPRVDLLVAGFPCQDLSQAGRATGISGKNSSLVSYVFSLIQSSRSKPKWIMLENVPFMLKLERGRAMSMLVQKTEELGYRWAYRVVDLRAFGLPHRRRRVIFLASRVESPENVLLSDNVKPLNFELPMEGAHGFYWTEGNTGLGWTFDGIPALKAGSTIGIPSPPGIWFPGKKHIVTPDIRDAERLQGFPADWTRLANDIGRKASRWKLVGNAFP